MKTYKIIRFHLYDDNETVRTGLTLEQAQEHCQHNDTATGDWFDGYTAEGEEE